MAGRALSGALAAALTPLCEAGDALEEDAIGTYVDSLGEGGLDGILVLGTTGEGIPLSASERRRAAERFVAAAAGRIRVAVHCGAQTTRATVGLAAHAAGIGADGVAVIGPPYYALDDHALLAHFEAAARACFPTPFYLYEFAARSGYAIPLAVIERLRERAPNLAGLKVSETPFERFEPYLVEGLDVLVGPEALIARGLERGAVGAVSGLAAAFPEVVAALVRTPSEEDAARVGALRGAVQRFPFHAAQKRNVVRRGVAIREDVRAPLRTLTAQERAELDAAVDAWRASESAARAR
jgi:dihydrodipicolinate synthase/N-acetylneuraminate lyase